MEGGAREIPLGSEACRFIFGEPEGNSCKRYPRKVCGWINTHRKLTSAEPGIIEANVFTNSQLVPRKILRGRHGPLSKRVSSFRRFSFGPTDNAAIFTALRHARQAKLVKVEASKLKQVCTSSRSVGTNSQLRRCSSKRDEIGNLSTNRKSIPPATFKRIATS